MVIINKENDLIKIDNLMSQSRMDVRIIVIHVSIVILMNVLFILPSIPDI
jgi:CHASE3 domain sensor protein